MQIFFEYFIISARRNTFSSNYQHPLVLSEHIVPAVNTPVNVLPCGCGLMVVCCFWKPHGFALSALLQVYFLPKSKKSPNIVL